MSSLSLVCNRAEINGVDCSVGEDGRFERVGAAVVQVSRSIGQPPLLRPVIAFMVWLGVTQIKERRRKG